MRFNINKFSRILSIHKFINENIFKMNQFEKDIYKNMKKYHDIFKRIKSYKIFHLFI